MNGLDPAYVTPSPEAPIRLELSGEGQLASPLQGAWILSNLIWQVTPNGIHASDQHPRNVVAEMCRKLLASTDQIWDVPGYTKSMNIFHQEIESLDRPWAFSHPDDFDSDEA